MYTSGYALMAIGSGFEVGAFSGRFLIGLPDVDVVLMAIGGVFGVNLAAFLEVIAR